MLRQIPRVLRSANVRASVRPALAMTRPAVARPAMTNWVRMYSSGPNGLERTDVEKRILGVFKVFDKVKSPETVTVASHFVSDLNLDSLDIVEVIVAIEEEFGIEIPDKESDEIKSIENAVEYILAQPEAH